MIDERPFQRLLRWYPKRWRQQNAGILLSTLLDAAEHDGRTAPTSAERFAAAVHGTTARFDLRSAVVAAVAAMVCAVAGVVLWATGPDTHAWLWLLLTAGLSPALSAFAVLATLRSRGLLGDGRAIISTAAATVAFALSVLTSASWALAFDDADTGVPATGLASMWLPLAASAWVCGAIAVALVFDIVFRRTRTPPVARLALSVVTGAFVAPVVGLGLVPPYGAAVAAMGVVAAVLFLPTKTSVAAASSPIAPRPVAPAHEPRPTIARATRSTARLLAWVATAGGLVGVVYAFSGAQWSVGATDTSVAMGQGITILLISGIPLLASFGLLLTGRPSPMKRIHIWGPLLMGVLALLGLTLWYTDPANSGELTPPLVAASFMLGAGVGWWIIPRVRLPGRSAVLLGVLTGAFVGSVGVIFFVLMLSFVFPVFGLLVALWPLRRPDQTAAAVPGR